MNKEELYEKAMSKWGSTAQLLMLVEELGELQKEILKFIRNPINYNAICDEFADVTIMMEQITKYFEDNGADFTEDIDKQIVKKLIRLKGVLLDEHDSKPKP